MSGPRPEWKNCTDGTSVCLGDGHLALLRNDKVQLYASGCKSVGKQTFHRTIAQCDSNDMIDQQQQWIEKAGKQVRQVATSEKTAARMWLVANKEVAQVAGKTI